MSCHDDRARKLKWPWASLLRPELDNRGLKVESVRDMIFTENTRLGSYFERKVEWRALNLVSTQNEGSSQHVIENKGRGFLRAMF
jgi:hypothetical protein